MQDVVIKHVQGDTDEAIKSQDLNRCFPDHWSVVKLAEVLREVDVRAEDLKIVESEQVPVLSLTKNNGLIPQSERFNSRVATQDISNYKVIKEGQIVYNPFVLWEGAIYALKGREQGLVSPVYLVWEATDANNYFLDYLLRTTQLLNEYLRVASGVVQRRRAVRKDIFLNISIPLPPLPEQHAIAQILQAVQDAIQARRDELKLERERKSALMEYLFTYGTVPLNQINNLSLIETEIGLIPKQWQVVQLNSVAHLLSGGTPSKQRSEWWQGTIPWASPKDLKQPRLWDTQDHISIEALEQGSRLVPPKTLFIVVRGMILAKDIPVALIETPMAFNQDIKAIVPSSYVDPEYLLYALQKYKENLTRVIGTSAHGTRRIGTASLEDLLLPLPPVEEQQKIGQMLYACEPKISALEQEVVLLKELFHSLLEELMTGRLSTLPLIVKGETHD